MSERQLDVYVRGAILVSDYHIRCLKESLERRDVATAESLRSQYYRDLEKLFIGYAGEIHTDGLVVFKALDFNAGAMIDNGELIPIQDRIFMKDN